MKHKMWMVRAGKKGFLFYCFKDKEIVAIGHNYLGDLKKIKNDEQLRAKFNQEKPKYSAYQISQRITKIRYFRDKMSIGDYVITYNPKEREYYCGRINSEHETDYDRLCKFQNIRRVRWNGSVDRDSLSKDAKDNLKQHSAVFPIDDNIAEEIVEKCKDIL